jgi:D-glycero-D-manno-heptose 1,7-bisphosphate phosphatase
VAGARAVFVDRDGVINEELGHVDRPERFRLLPGAAQGLRLLRAAGWKLVVVTNQAGIARGLYTQADYERLTAHMHAVLRDEGVTLDAVYHCPHHPSAGQGALRLACACRKPAPGMLLRAATELGLSLGASVIVGDKRSDIEAGRAAGVGRCVLVRSGHPIGAPDRRAADLCCADLREAAARIVDDDRRAVPASGQAAGFFATSVRMS